MPLFQKLRSLAGSAKRWFRGHPRQALMAVVLTLIIGSALLWNHNPLASLILGLSVLAAFSLLQIESIARKQIELELVRGIYLKTPLPKVSQKVIRTIELNFIDKSRAFEANHLVTAYECADELQSNKIIKLALVLANRGYLNLAKSYLVRANRTASNAKITSQLALLEKRIGLISSDFEIDLPKKQIQPVQGRVLHVVKQTLLDKQAGYTIRTHKIARAQVELGLDVHVVGQYGFGKEAGNKVVDGVTYHTLSKDSGAEHGSDTGWFKKNTNALYKLAEELQPEFLHAASDYLNGAAASICGHALGIKVVYEIRGFWEETFMSNFVEKYGHEVKPTNAKGQELVPDSYALRQASEAKWALAADQVLTLAPTMKERIQEWGVSPKKIAIVPNAVTPEEFKPLARDVQLLEQIGFKKDTLVIGYISSLSAYEGVDLLIKAVAKLTKKLSNRELGLLVVGGGKELQRLRELAKQVGGHNIRLLGQVPHKDVGRYYSIIDVFAVPRLPYDVCHLVTPLKPYEAMAMGKALVMSDVRALASIAKESRAALTFKAGNVDSLEEVLTTLIEDEDLRSKMGARASAWVRKNRTWKQVAETTIEVYTRLRGSK